MQRFIQVLIRLFLIGTIGFFAISILIKQQSILAIVVIAIVVASGTLWLIVNLDRGKLGRFQVPPQYERLGSYLEAGEWKKADKETTRLLIEGEEMSLFNAVWTNLPNRTRPIEFFTIPTKRILDYCQSIPCEKIQIIDLLWAYFSRGYFGLSIQNRVMQENGINNFNLLAHHLGWKQNNNWIGYESPAFGINAPRGHFPVDFFFSIDRELVRELQITPINYDVLRRKPHVTWHTFVLRMIGEFNNGDADVIWGTIVWEALISRLGVCIVGEKTNEALQIQGDIETFLMNERWNNVVSENSNHHLIAFNDINEPDDAGEETSQFPCEHQLETSINQL